MRTSHRLNKGFSYMDALVAILGFSLFWGGAVSTLGQLTLRTGDAEKKAQSVLLGWESRPIEQLLP